MNFWHNTCCFDLLVSNYDVPIRAWCIFFSMIHVVYLQLHDVQTKKGQAVQYHIKSVRKSTFKCKHLRISQYRDSLVAASDFPNGEPELLNTSTRPANIS